MILAGLAVVVSGCDATGGSEAEPPGSTAGPSSSPTLAVTPTPAPDLGAIRRVDLGDQTWVEVQRGEKVTLKNGVLKAKGLSWTTPKKLQVYADANDDGYLDVLAPLQRVDGNGYEVGYYVWLWNPVTSGAEQVKDVVALTVRCGDEVTKTRAASGGGFEIREKRRLASDTTSCVDGGSVRITRTVAVEDQLLVQTKPLRGYGGVCTESAFDGIIQPAAGKVTIRLAPKDKAPLAIKSNQIELLLDNAEANYDRWPENWVQVTFRAKGVKKSVQPLPCGFAYVKPEPFREDG
ncbi:MAG TPA: hypothetical protein VIT20_01870 [Propionibacteriaceae bacterium]